jgi:hypothetical protein
MNKDYSINHVLNYSLTSASWLNLTIPRLDGEGRLTLGGSGLTVTFFSREKESMEICVCTELSCLT